MKFFSFFGIAAGIAGMSLSFYISTLTCSTAEGAPHVAYRSALVLFCIFAYFTLVSLIMAFRYSRQAAR